MPTDVWYRGNGVDIRYVGTKFSTIARNGDIATKNALRATSSWVLLKARGYVPFKTGRLMASGRVRGNKESVTAALQMTHSGRNVSIVTFGNASVRYAVLQHENKDFYHPHGRIRLYLKVALDQANAGKILDRAIKNGLKTVHKDFAAMKALMIPV